MCYIPRKRLVSKQDYPRRDSALNTVCWVMVVILACCLTDDNLFPLKHHLDHHGTLKILTLVEYLTIICWRSRII